MRPTIGLNETYYRASTNSKLHEWFLSFAKEPYQHRALLLKNPGGTKETGLLSKREAS